MRYRCFALLIMVALAACAQSPADTNYVRICDPGCHDQPKSVVTYHPLVDSANAHESERIRALETAANAEPRAAYDLGLRYFRGDGVTQDSYQALVWMRKAAERGELGAQKALGVFYLFGLEEMGSDPREAEKWLQIAADRGDGESKKLLIQARAAKKSDEDYYRWQSQWRTMYYGYWQTGYAYRGYWRGNAWYW